MQVKSMVATTISLLIHLGFGQKLIIPAANHQIPDQANESVKDQQYADGKGVSAYGCGRNDQKADSIKQRDGALGDMQHSQKLVCFVGDGFFTGKIGQDKTNVSENKATHQKHRLLFHKKANEESDHHKG